MLRAVTNTTLHAVERGEGPSLVLAHGFTQNAQCWGHLADDLAQDHRLVLVDLPGHGASDPSFDTSNLQEAADALVEAGGNGVYVGYSMGGRVALHAALSHPESIRGLVLIGATAGIDDEHARQARREADDDLAARLEAMGLAAFLDRWLSNPLFAGLTPETACKTQRLTNRVEGLAASLRNTGTGNQEPLWSRLGEIDLPVLLIAGSEDAKFTDIGLRMAEYLPRASLMSLPGTHAVHLETPTPVASVIRRAVAEFTR